MKKTLILALALLAGVVTVPAQTYHDEETERLLDIVLSLRSASEEAFNQAVTSLEPDYKWTPMNETGPLVSGECRPGDPLQRFKLNRILSRVAANRTGVATRGDMLNGEDTRYNYSLYERSVKARETVSFTLAGREGRQFFAIVPFEADSRLRATLTLPSGEKLAFAPGAGGVLFLYADRPELTAEQPLCVTVTGGKRNQAFVILNHNTRNKH